jgi:hypothetical protein
MRIALLFILISGFLSIRAQNLGLGLTLVPESGLWGFQARGAYNATEKLAISAAYNFYVKKGTNFSLDLDAQFKILSIRNLNISPFAGINIGKRENTSLNTGLELGLFILVPQEGIDFYVEPKAILDQETVIALAGGFYF